MGGLMGGLMGGIVICGLKRPNFDIQGLRFLGLQQSHFLKLTYGQIGPLK